MDDEEGSTRVVPDAKEEGEKAARTNYSFDGLIEIHETPMGNGYRDPARDAHCPQLTTKMRETGAW